MKTKKSWPNLILLSALVCAILALLSAFVLTVTVKLKVRDIERKDTCANQLVMIKQVTDLFALTNKLTKGAKLSAAEIHRLGVDEIICPAGGKYTVGYVGLRPTCSLPEHSPADLGKSRGVIIRHAKTNAVPLAESQLRDLPPYQDRAFRRKTP